MQTGLFLEQGKPFEYENIVSNINKLTNWARNNEVGVVFIQHETKEEILEFESSGWELVPDLNVDSEDYFVRKTTPNSFLRTNLNEVLEKNNINTVIICGYATEFCVDSTVRAAAALGYDIKIVTDGNTTHDKAHAPAKQIIEHHNVTLPNITSFGVKIEAVDSEKIMNSKWE